MTNIIGVKPNSPSIILEELAVTRTASELVNEHLEKLYIAHIKQSVGG